MRLSHPLFEALTHTNALDTVDEGSFTPEDVPGVFFVVIPLDLDQPERMQQLADRELVGVKGISSSKEIVIDFLGIARDAMITMPAKKVLELNKITRVMYDNPRYLASKNLWPLYRLWNKNIDKPSGRSALMQNFLEYFAAALGTLPDGAALAYAMKGGYIGRGVDDLFGKENPTITSPEDLSRWLIKTMPTAVKYESQKEVVKKAFPVFLPAVMKVLETTGKLYASEGEWYIKDNVLKIPEDSTLIVLKPDIDLEKYKKWKENPLSFFVKQWDFEKWSKIQEAVKTYHLDTTYRLKYLDQAKFDATRKNLFNKRSSKT